MSATLITSETVATPRGTINLLVRAGVGARRTIVFLHGIGSNATSFQSLLEAMPPGLNHYAWNAPGYGTSTPLAEPWPLPIDYAAALHDLLAARGLGQTAVDIVSHSLGCLVAGAFARVHPDRVRRLVLMAPAQGYRVARGGTLPDVVAARITDIETLGPARMAAARADRLVHDPVSKPNIVESVRQGMASLNSAGYAQAVRMLASGDLLADIANITAPTLVLTGLDDRITPASGSRRVRDALAARTGQRTTSDRYLEIPAAGHAVYLEAEAQVAAALSDFLGDEA